MTTEPVTLETLLETRDRLLRELPAGIDSHEQEFLRTLVRARPNWSLLDIRHLHELPAIQWRLQNLDNSNGLRHADSAHWQICSTNVYKEDRASRD